MSYPKCKHGVQTMTVGCVHCELEGSRNFANKIESQLKGANRRIADLEGDLVSALKVILAAIHSAADTGHVSYAIRIADKINEKIPGWELLLDRKSAKSGGDGG